jgi:hypothetical protein
MSPRTLLRAAAALAGAAGLGCADREPVELAQAGETCFLKSETVDGLNKICFYTCPSGEAAITIPATSLCPISIHR